jgi:hypothetical protein
VLTASKTIAGKDELQHFANFSIGAQVDSAFAESGVALVNQIARRLGGGFTFEGDDERNAHFRVFLPRATINETDDKI